MDQGNLSLPGLGVAGAPVNRLSGGLLEIEEHCGGFV